MQGKYLLVVTHNLCGGQQPNPAFCGDLQDLISQNNNTSQSRDNWQQLFEIRRLLRPGLINSLTAGLCTTHHTAPVVYCWYKWFEN